MERGVRAASLGATLERAAARPLRRAIAWALAASGYDRLRVLLGLLLLLAAALKTHQVATEPVLRNGLLDSRWFLVGVVEFELLFGLWLLAGLAPRCTWRAALALFSMFAVVTAYKGIRGDPTCGCFGRITVNPWYTLALDALAVVALTRWRPIHAHRASPGVRRRSVIWVLTVWAAVGLPAALTVEASSSARDDEERYWREASNSPLEPDAAIGRTLLRLDHDFGILKPAQSARHRYPIANQSNGAWTIRKIINPCGCTVVDGTASTIAPGETEWMDVEYRAATATQDDQRRVVILFHEPEAPVVVLGMRAKVREAMTLVPAELAFRDLAQGHVRDGNFEVQNFGDRVWEDLLIEPSAPWIQISTLRVAPVAPTHMPRQSWRVGVRADAQELPPGDHVASLLVTAKGLNVAARTVPVRATVTSPVCAIPAQFFFGSVRRGGSATRRVMIQFTTEAKPAARESVVWEHDLGNNLRLAWASTEGNCWELEGTLRATSEHSVLQGTVEIRFAQSGTARLRLPVYAFIEGKP